MYCAMERCDGLEAERTRQRARSRMNSASEDDEAAARAVEKFGVCELLARRAVWRAAPRISGAETFSGTRKLASSSTCFVVHHVVG